MRLDKFVCLADPLPLFGNAFSSAVEVLVIINFLCCCRVKNASVLLFVYLCIHVLVFFIFSLVEIYQRTFNSNVTVLCQKLARAVLVVFHYLSFVFFGVCRVHGMLVQPRLMLYPFL